MNILLIGSGGREHAISISLQKSSKLGTLYIAPGNAGTADIGTNVDIKDSDLPALLTFAKEKKIDLTIVGPEAPLVAGIVDLFESEGLKIIGPSKAGAQLEGSKEWAKALMIRAGIKTAVYERFNTFDPAKDYILNKNTYPIVIKADGLAAGKGVTIAQSEDEAVKALEECFLENKFLDAGNVVVIEDFLLGEEASLFAFTDGKTIVPMVPAQDHKAVYDGDKGPNTGGMGAYAPAPIVTKEVYDRVQKEVFEPLLATFQKENIKYKGIVYAGLMIHEGETSIVEFNARFGDPETQVVLPKLKTDLLEVFLAMANERLSEINLEWDEDAAVCVVLAAEGYPGSYPKNIELTQLSSEQPNINIVHAGTKQDGDKVLSTGGRILGVVSKGADLKKAIDDAYVAVDKVQFEHKYYRRDIGQKAL